MTAARATGFSWRPRTSTRIPAVANRLWLAADGGAGLRGL